MTMTPAKPMSDKEYRIAMLAFLERNDEVSFSEIAERALILAKSYAQSRQAAAVEDAVDVAIAEERIMANEPTYSLDEAKAILGIKDDEVK